MKTTSKNEGDLNNIKNEEKLKKNEDYIQKKMKPTKRNEDDHKKD